MTVRRLSTTEIEIDLPLVEAREAVWRACFDLGWRRMVIDAKANQVVGYASPVSWRGGIRTTASFEARDQGAIFTIASFSEVPGNWNSGKDRKRADQFANLLESTLRSQGTIPPIAPERGSGGGYLPIASPTTPMPSPFFPVYAPAPPVKLGGEVFRLGQICTLVCIYIDTFFSRWAQIPGARGDVAVFSLVGGISLVAATAAFAGVTLYKHSSDRDADLSLVNWAILNVVLAGFCLLGASLRWL